MSVARTQPLEVRVALSPLITLTRMLIDGFGGIPVGSPSSSSTSGPPAVWGDETHSMPEFMLPAPGGTRTRLREELAQVAATPSSIVRRDVAYDSVSLSGSPRPPAPFDSFVRAPRSSVQQHCLAVNEWAAPLARVTIPDVAGQPRTRALSLLEDTGLRARSRRESSESIENEAATRTNPPAGAEVDSNSGVTLYLSSGPALAPATVPDVKGRPRAAALAILSAAGFRPTGATEPSRSVGEGTAIRTDPPAGARVDRGASVKLFVSSGTGTSTVELPDLSGHPAAEALAVLRDTGLRPLSAPEGSEFVREGVVTLTVPAAGASVEEGSDVTVFVSSGRPPGECEDGADNDDDGEIDGADPQCKQSHGQSESDVPGEG